MRKVWPVLAILFGILLLIGSLGDFFEKNTNELVGIANIIGNIFGAVLGVAMIYYGIKLLKKDKQGLKKDRQEGVTNVANTRNVQPQKEGFPKWIKWFIFAVIFLTILTFVSNIIISAIFE